MSQGWSAMVSVCPPGGRSASGRRRPAGGGGRGVAPSGGGERGGVAPSGPREARSEPHTVLVTESVLTEQIR